MHIFTFLDRRKIIWTGFCPTACPTLPNLLFLIRRERSGFWSERYVLIRKSEVFLHQNLSWDGLWLCSSLRDEKELDLNRFQSNSNLIQLPDLTLSKRVWLLPRSEENLNGQLSAWSTETLFSAEWLLAGLLQILVLDRKRIHRGGHQPTSHHSRTQPVSKNSLPPRCCCSLRLHSTGFWSPSIHLHTDQTQQHLLWNCFGGFPQFSFLKFVNPQKENLPSQRRTKLDRFLCSLPSSEQSENKIVPSEWDSTQVNFQLSWKIFQATLFDVIQLCLEFFESFIILRVT